MKKCEKKHNPRWNRQKKMPLYFYWWASNISKFSKKWRLSGFIISKNSSFCQWAFASFFMHRRCASFFKQKKHCSRSAFCVELVIRIELMTSSLPMTCSTDWAIAASSAPCAATFDIITKSQGLVNRFLKKIWKKFDVFAKKWDTGRKKPHYSLDKIC